MLNFSITTGHSLISDYKLQLNSTQLGLPNFTTYQTRDVVKSAFTLRSAIKTAFHGVLERYIPMCMIQKRKKGIAVTFMNGHLVMLLFKSLAILCSKMYC